MPITRIAPTTEEASKPVVLSVAYRGLCLKISEVPVYKDVDFYMLLWNPEEKLAEEVLYTSASDPDFAEVMAEVDATPEVRAAYEAYRNSFKMERLRAA